MTDLDAADRAGRPGGPSDRAVPTPARERLSVSVRPVTDLGTTSRRAVLWGSAGTAIAAALPHGTVRTGAREQVEATQQATQQAAPARPQQYTTTTDLSQTMKPYSPPAFTPMAAAPAGSITVDATVTGQAFDGVGASLTDSSASLLWAMDPTDRLALLTEMYGTNGFSTVRICFGSSDFSSVEPYTYRDTEDPALSRVYIDRDRAYILPVLKLIRQVNPAVKIIAAAWTAPAWMKSGMSDPARPYAGGTLQPRYAVTYARYVHLSLLAYRDAGIPVHAVSPQNEPGHSTSYPSMLMSDSTMATVVSTLGKLLADGPLTTRLWALDANWGDAGILDRLLASDASRWIDGISWHGYGGQPTTEGRYVTRGLEQHNTEFRTFVSEASQTAMQKLASDWTITSMRNGARSVTMWNVALRRDGTPTLQSKGRQGVVSIDGTTSADVTRTTGFWLLSHFGRAVRLGAVRVRSTTCGQGRASRTLQSVAFRNPDGSIALAVFNNSTDRKAFTVLDAGRGQGFPATLVPGAFATFTWGP